VIVKSTNVGKIVVRRAGRNFVIVFIGGGAARRVVCRINQSGTPFLFFHPHPLPRCRCSPSPAQPSLQLRVATCFSSNECPERECPGVQSGARFAYVGNFFLRDHRHHPSSPPSAGAACRGCAPSIAL